MTSFQHLKFWLGANLGLDKDALHVYFALILLFGSALLFRWPLRGWKPCALVFGFAVAGEIWDIRDGLKTQVPLSLSVPAGVHDIWNTMFWPVAILLLARFTGVFDRPEPEPPVR